MNALTLINNDISTTRVNGKNKHTKHATSCKHRNSKKGQRTDDYFLDITNKERNKQTKIRFDTHRREEQPDAEDVRLENIHFDNFLGNTALIKNYETEYNTEATININLCDISRPEPSELGLDLDQHLERLDDNLERLDGNLEADQYSDYDPNDPSNFYDEEADREENYTEMCYDERYYSWRIWHPASNKFVESDDDHSCY